ncbi:MAG: hypothetical protein JSU73_04875 [candidate division WOR-3 bacterium]|nr:MAG: hypothetical protein JSU73_04875 [candidate division WOR-3 bacterium]
MHKKIEMSVIFGLVVALGAVAAGLAHVHEASVGQDPAPHLECAPAIGGFPPLELPVQDSAQWEEYTPSAHCGLGSGLHDIDSH